MDYSQRSIASVEFFALNGHAMGAAGYRIGGQVSIRLGGVIDGTGGPEVTVNTSIPAREDMTLGVAQRELLAAALAVLGRVLQESPDALQEKISPGVLPPVPRV